MSAIAGALLKFLGGLLGDLTAKFGALFVAFRAGESAQAAKDQKAVLDADQDARQVDAANAARGDDELRRRLLRPGDQI